MPDELKPWKLTPETVKHAQAVFEKGEGPLMVAEDGGSLAIEICKEALASLTRTQAPASPVPTEPERLKEGEYER